MAQTPQQASFSLRLHNKGGDRIKLSKPSKTCPVRGKAIPEFSLSWRISRRRRLADCETLQKRSLGAPSTYSSAIESAAPARVTRRWRLTGQLANLAVLQYVRPRASLRATKSEIHTWLFEMTASTRSRSCKANISSHPDITPHGHSRLSQIRTRIRPVPESR